MSLGRAVSMIMIQGPIFWISNSDIPYSKNVISLSLETCHNPLSESMQIQSKESGPLRKVKSGTRRTGKACRPFKIFFESSRQSIPLPYRERPHLVSPEMAATKFSQSVSIRVLFGTVVALTFGPRVNALVHSQAALKFFQFPVPAAPIDQDSSKNPHAHIWRTKSCSESGHGSHHALWTYQSTKMDHILQFDCGDCRWL